MSQLENNHLHLRVFRGIILTALFMLIFLMILGLLLVVAIHLGTLLNTFGDSLAKTIFTMEIIGASALIIISKAINHYWESKRREGMQ